MTPLSPNVLALSQDFSMHTPAFDLPPDFLG
jgi:hypothetical protein